MASIIPTIVREIKDDLAKRSLEMLRTCIGFIYSNENLGLELRSLTANTTLSNRDAVVMVDTTSGAVTLTLPLATTWSPANSGFYKTPLLFIKKTAGTNTLTVQTSGSDTLIQGGSSVSSAAGDFFWLYSDGVSKWYDAGLNISSMLVKTTYTSGSGTHTFNTAAKWARVTMIAAGGGGGGGNNHSTAGSRVGGGGGGSGEYLSVIIYPSLEGATAAYSVGSKGTGGAGTASTSAGASNGTAGGNTTFSNYLTIGGSGGRGGDTIAGAGVGGAGGGFVGSGAGGTVSDGAAVAAGTGGFASEAVDQRIPGAGGGGAGRGVTATYRDGGTGGGVLGRLFGSGGAGSGSGAGGGAGGGTAVGAGAAGGAQGANGTAATITGTGGGGAGSGAGAGTSPSGGNGADGVIIIEEFA